MSDTGHDIAGQTHFIVQALSLSSFCEIRRGPGLDNENAKACRAELFGLGSPARERRVSTMRQDYDATIAGAVEITGERRPRLRRNRDPPLRRERGGLGRAALRARRMTRGGEKKHDGVERRS
jgi:hypothetical protein